MNVLSLAEGIVCGGAGLHNETMQQAEQQVALLCQVLRHRPVPLCLSMLQVCHGACFCQYHMCRLDVDCCSKHLNSLCFSCTLAALQRANFDYLGTPSCLLLLLLLAHIRQLIMKSCSSLGQSFLCIDVNMASSIHANAQLFAAKVCYVVEQGTAAGPYQLMDRA